MNSELIEKVWRRASSRCEYCQIPAADYAPPFQIDHVIARQHGGLAEFQNLALACIHCNRFKGPNIAGYDAETKDVVRLFNPRRDVWSDHFRWDQFILVGTTAIGRVTMTVLFINDPESVVLRKTIAEQVAPIPRARPV